MGNFIINVPLFLIGQREGKGKTFRGNKSASTPAEREKNPNQTQKPQK